MIDVILILCKAVYSVFAVSAIMFGVCNLANFKAFIVPNLTLLLFYIFSILCLILTVVTCWLKTAHWYHLTWLISNALLRDCEICFVYCQTLAFL